MYKSAGGDLYNSGYLLNKFFNGLLQQTLKGICGVVVWGWRGLNVQTFSAKRLLSFKFATTLWPSQFCLEEVEAWTVIACQTFQTPCFQLFRCVSKNTLFLILNHHEDWSLMTNDCCIVLAFTARSIIWKSSGHPSNSSCPFSYHLFVNCVTHPISNAALST